jgi:hypothetical protein
MVVLDEIDKIYSEEDDRKAIEALVVDNADLERLEELLSPFNIFEAIGVVRQELRHSDFLAFLLDPQENHGLGSFFLKRLLQKAIINSDHQDLPISPIDIDIWMMDDVEILREWNNIDILIVNQLKEFVVIIENKIGTGEHDDQLARYWDIVRHRYRGWRILALYLTPDGLHATEDHYISIDYHLVNDILESIIRNRTASLGSDVRMAIMHYTDMLRRHIVGGSEIETLCKQIYAKHRRAMELIIQHRPDLQEAIYDLLKKFITETKGIELDDWHDKRYFDFYITEWINPNLIYKFGYLVCFEFENIENVIRLDMYLMRNVDDKTREKIYDIAYNHKPPFTCSRKTLSKGNTKVYSFILLKSPAEVGNIEEIEAILRTRWAHFLEVDLPAINEVFRKGKWLWQEK